MVSWWADSFARVGVGRKPIKQNKNHITELRKTLKQFKNIPFFSVIVFFGDCELKEINYVPKGTYLVKSHRVFEVLNLIKNENESIKYINKREVVETLRKLVSLGENVDFQKQHIENIKEMVGKERIFKWSLQPIYFSIFITDEKNQKTIF